MANNGRPDLVARGDWATVLVEPSRLVQVTFLWPTFLLATAQHYRMDYPSD